MKVGMVGLGRMGMNMARRLLAKGHEVVAYNRTPDKTRELMAHGAQGAFSLDELVDSLDPPRIVWIMLPAGRPVDEHIERLSPMISRGDVIVDGGNSFYKDDLRRGEALSKRGIHYVDAGVSGGVWGLEKGYCIMVGGERRVFERLRPLLEALCAPGGYMYCGPNGAGHFVKMVHNGIEYGLMQAYAEGFSLIEASPYGEGINYADLARLWNTGSVIRSWLLELLEEAFTEDPSLEGIRGYVEDSGEGRWTVQQAVELGVPVPVIAASLFARFRSREEDAFSDRVLAILRKMFGGHRVIPAAEGD